MKINNDNTGALTGAADGLVRVTNDAGSQAAAKPQAPASSGDQLTLSPEARLLQSATGEAEIRQDVVERARQLLDAGKVGNDAGALANAIIDDWLKLP
jgi:flagellar biosynthesis anti-sigma factor FlgM